MTSTDEVRRLLDEQGVEYETADSYRCKFTLWRNNGIDAGWDDSENWEQPHLLIIGFTPEQAIEATLGSLTEQVTEQAAKDTGAGTCHDTWERIIKDAREYRLNINGSYLWKNKSDELVARCKALAGDAE